MLKEIYLGRNRVPDTGFMDLIIEALGIKRCAIQILDLSSMSLKNPAILKLI